MTHKKLSLFTCIALLLAISCKEVQPTETGKGIDPEPIEGAQH